MADGAYESMAPDGVACARMCEAEGEHLHQGLLHRPSHFCVHVRDANGQRLRKGGDRLRVTSRGPGQLRPSVKDVGNGRYDVSYLATLSGSYQLAITCNNAPVRGSPFSLLIEPGVAHAPSCTIDAAGLAELAAGERARFTVRAYGECGRPKIMGGETFDALNPQPPPLFINGSIYSTSPPHTPPRPIYKRFNNY